MGLREPTVLGNETCGNIGSFCAVVVGGPTWKQKGSELQFLCKESAVIRMACQTLFFFDVFSDFKRVAKLTNKVGSFAHKCKGMRFRAQEKRFGVPGTSNRVWGCGYKSKGMDPRE